MPTLSELENMPPNLDERNREILSQISSISETPIIGTPTTTPSDLTSYDSDSGIQLNSASAVVYEKINIPIEQNLKELLIEITGTKNLATITEVKLRVIAREVSLQHLSIHTPNLRELTLDGSYVSSLRDLGCKLKNLKILRINRCHLTSLDGLFGLEHLEELYAAKNEIADASLCSCLFQAKVIDLRGNRLKCIQSLGYLSLCTKLEDLYLEGNDEIEFFPKYRQSIKNLLPALKTLDGVPFTEEECSKEFAEVEEEEFEKYLEVSTAEKHEEDLGFENSPRQVRPATTGGHCLYSASFPPKVLSPRPATTSAVSNNVTKMPATSPLIADIRTQIVPSNLTSGAPMCGNVAAALRNRSHNFEAWEED